MIITRHLPAIFSLLLLSSLASAQANHLRLLQAAEQDDVEAALALLAAGVEAAAVGATRADGATALHWAAHWDRAQLAQALLQAGAAVDAANDHGVTPLALACRNGSLAMAGLLLEAGADARRSAPGGETALMSCARTGSAAAVTMLLAAGADPNASESGSGQTALMWAAAGAHAATAASLIEAGADVNARSQGEFTPLLFAARAGALELARLLIESGADVNAATAEGLSPLVVAAASLDAITGSDYRLVVSPSDHEALALLLLDNGADVAQADRHGMTALHYSVEMGKPRLLRALLDRGADPNAQLTEGLPFRRGDYVGRQAYNGASPFWLAARLGEVDMMRALLAAGADPELPSAYGVTPLMVAAGLTQTDSRMVAEDKLLAAVRMLTLEIGADIYAVDRGGQTAVHGAANVSGDALIRFLVEQGADPMAQDQRGRTPLDVATRTLRPRPSTAALIRELAALR